MELYVLRHAIAGAKSASIPGGDSQRALTPEGKKKMRRIARGMKAMRLSFDLILSSPYVRARQTADIVAETFRLEKRLELSPALTPDGAPGDLINELNKGHHGRKKILLVGHEPYLSNLISVLLAGDTSLSIELKKGGLCKLSADTLRYGACATLNWLLAPRQMRLIK